MKILLQKILDAQVKAVLKKYRPKVVGITGSFGKTSTKEAAALVVGAKYSVGKSEKNLNNAYGIPLAVLGARDPLGSSFGWMRVVLRGFRLMLLRDRQYPEVLVLEMGADRPGDIVHLTTLVPCDVGLITSIGVSHLEYFESAEQLQAEKAVIVSHLGKDGVAVLNRDDALSFAQKGHTMARVLTYGEHSDATVQMRSVMYRYDTESFGLHFKLSSGGSTVPVHIHQALGAPALQAAISAASVGVALGIDLVTIAEALSSYRALPGRLTYIEGIKGTHLIDDTYNASPEAALAAIDVLVGFDTGGARWAVLGDMLELGSVSESEHRRVGDYLAGKPVDYLVVVGERSVDMMHAACKAGFEEDKVFHFDTSAEAGRFLQDRIKQADVVLVKGSQGVRMEKIVKEIMAEPQRAGELLCRQDSTWV